MAKRDYYDILGVPKNASEDDIKAYPTVQMVEAMREWVDAGKPRGKVLMAGSSVGTSQLFVTSNLQTSRNNALPEAVERAGETMVSQLSNSY